MCKKYYISFHEFYYPIGLNLSVNSSRAEEIAAVLKQCIITNYPNTKTINFWCRGSSGPILATLVATYLGNHYLSNINHVKKENEESHSDNNYKYKELDQVNVVIDDFIRTGTTIDAILEATTKTGLNPEILCISGEVPSRYSPLFKDIIAYKIY